MTPTRSQLGLLSILLTFIASCVMAAEAATEAESGDSSLLELTIVVTGTKQEPEQPSGTHVEIIQNATVVVETAAGEMPELLTNSVGETVFIVPAGSVDVLVTGQDTELHWGTGSCTVEAENDMVAYFQLDLDEPVSECTQMPMINIKTLMKRLCVEKADQILKFLATINWQYHMSGERFFVAAFDDLPQPSTCNNKEPAVVDR